MPLRTTRCLLTCFFLYVHVSETAQTQTINRYDVLRHAKPVIDVRCCGSNHIVSIDDKNKVRVWDIKKRKLLVSKKTKGQLMGPIGLHATKGSIFWTNENTLLQTNISSLKTSKTPIACNPLCVINYVSLSEQNGLMLAGLLERHLVQLWDTNRGKKIGSIRTPTYIFGVDMSDDGRIIGILSRDNVWVKTLPKQLKKKEFNQLVANLNSDDYRERENATEALKQHALVHQDELNELLKSKKFSLEATRRLRIILNSLANVHLKSEFHGRVKGGVNDIALSSDGTQCAVSTHYSTEVWGKEGNTWKKKHTIKPGSLSIVFSPDDHWLVLSGHSLNDNRQYRSDVRIIDTKTGKLLQILQGHKDRVNAVDISSDGKSIVSAGEDGTVRNWYIRRREK